MIELGIDWYHNALDFPHLSPADQYKFYPNYFIFNDLGTLFLNLKNIAEFISFIMRDSITF